MTSVMLICLALAVVCLPGSAQRVHEGGSTLGSPEWTVLSSSQTDVIAQNAADTYASLGSAVDIVDSPNASGSFDQFHIVTKPFLGLPFTTTQGTGWIRTASGISYGPGVFATLLGDHRTSVLPYIVCDSIVTRLDVGDT